MSIGYAVLFGLILVVAISFVLMANEVLGFFLLLTARVLSEGLVQYSFGISGINAGSIFGAAIVVYSIAIIIFKKESEFAIPILIPYYLFLVLASFSLVNSGSLAVYTSHLFKYMAMASLFIIPYNIIQDETVGIKALKYFLFISILPMLYGYYQLFSGTGVHDQVHINVAFHKIMATFAHPNGYGFFLGLMFLTSTVLIQQDTKNTLFYYVFMLSSIVSIVFTYSRSVWLSVGVCSFIAFLPNKKLRIPLIIMSLLLFLGFSQIILERFDDLVNTDTADYSSNSLEFRIKMTKTLFDRAFTKHPFIGFGLGSTQSVSVKYAKMDTVPHNDYMRVLIESGIIGMVGFLSFIISNVVFLFRNFRYFGKNYYYMGLFVIIVYFTGIIIGTNTFGSISTGGMWFCLYGILFKLFKLSLNEKREESFKPVKAISYCDSPI